MFLYYLKDKCIKICQQTTINNSSTIANADADADAVDCCLSIREKREGRKDREREREVWIFVVKLSHCPSVTVVCSHSSATSA